MVTLIAMEMMSRVFVDTGVWFAYLVKNDHYHEKSVEIIDELQGEGALLVTSEPVVSETYTLLMRKFGHYAAMRFWDLLIEQMEKNFTRIIWTDRDIFLSAGKLLKKYSDQQLTYADAVSAVIAGRLHLPVATFDRHFRVLNLNCIP